MGVTKKIADVCVQAIEDIKTTANKELTRFEVKVYGKRLSKPVTFVFASRILGQKYFMKNFGKLPIEEIARMKRNKRE